MINLIMVESEMSILEKTFELSQFDEYREDNRREVKKRKVACRFLCGTPILPLRTAMVELSFLVSKKIKMVVGELPVSRMHLNYARNFGII